MPTRSLGTLTLDLVAKIGGFEQGMDKAGKASEKWRRQVSKDAKVVGTAIGAGIAAAAAGLAALTVQTVRSAEEIQRLASVANTSNSDFQRYAAGAKAVGVEQEKLADIFKDTSDKVGDFLQTGGGALADFFENIAPQVGVTAEEFRNLSGPDALGLYVSSLEKANVSQNEMTFFLEAIASDATLLLPLLRNNAEGFKVLGDEAARAGAILDEETITAAQDLNAAFFLAEQATTGIKNQLAQQLLPVLSEFAVELSEVSAEGSVAADVGQALATALKVAAAAATGAFAAFQLAGKGLGGLAAIVASIPDGWDAVSAAVDVVGDDLSDTADKYATAINKIMNAGEGANGEPEVNSRVRQLSTLMNDARLESRKTSDTIASNFSSVDAAAKAAEDALKREMEIQQDYQSLLKDLRTDEEVLTDQVRDRLAVLEAVKNITDEQRNATLGRIADSATMDAPEFSGGNTDEARADLEDWYSTQLDLLEKFRKDRADLNSTWDEEELSLRTEYEEQLTEIATANEHLRREQMLEGYSALLDVAGQFYQGLEGKEAAYARAAIAVGQTLLDEKKRDSLQSIVASTQSAAMGAYEALASIPYVGPVLGAAAAAGIYVTGGIAAAKVSGLAHDGIDSIPADGTWLLEKGERVTTSETSAKLDKTLSDIQGELQGSGRRGNTMGGSTQNIYVQGRVDNQTATQMQREAERKQRMTARRLGQ